MLSRDISVPETSEINSYIVLHSPIIFQKDKFSSSGASPLCLLNIKTHSLAIEWARGWTQEPSSDRICINQEVRSPDGSFPLKDHNGIQRVLASSFQEGNKDLSN